MSKVGEEFMSGVLNHLPSILAFTAPIPNSYDRLQPHMWSGAYLCWGKENKEAPLRTACPPGIPDGLVSNFEIKAIDGCANPYLALSSIIASGIDGLRRHLNLPEPINEDPQDGKVQRLPQSLSESVDALEKDIALEKLIGEKLLLAVKGVRKICGYRLAAHCNIVARSIETIMLGDKRIGIKTSVLEEKAIACNMICCYVDELKEGFFPWIDQVAPTLVPLLKFYFHEDVRNAVVSAIPDLLRSAKLAVEKGQSQGRNESYVKQLLITQKFMPGLCIFP
ncbi:hypothetical protein POM88_035101 [Heracleum sosnowskyi]|uniref:GS catalytic domain-containing protein n=1 Tax=Heracleum sosnowskyi TaxID=360622 RepID=A0AAD8HKS6_9APIA|nr:hypothetical protein POM88_035101 [Heracleum sosnowskyi]